MVEEYGIDEGRIIIRKQSRSTFGGIIEAMRALDALGVAKDDALGFAMQNNHWPRARDYGKLLLPATDIRLIPAQDPPRLSAAKSAQSDNDALAERVYGFALRGVEPGNIDGILRGAAMRERIVSGVITLGVAALAVHERVA
jgi:hypothetical protein